MAAAANSPSRARFWAAATAVLLFNLFWYGRLLSFPLIGEDGAANYSFLLENLEGRNPFTTAFPIKWLEGLGQPNPFVTVTFDPFSWVMLLPLDAADTFRISMAMRATACWATTYLFVRLLFRGRADIAMLAATVNMVMSFTLGHSRGVPTIAGIPNATHYAIYPLLLWCALKVLRSRPWISREDAWFVLMLAFFFITFPLSSVIGFAVLLVFAFGFLILSPRDAQGTAAIGIAKILAIATAILLLPELGLWHAWSAVVNSSARVVFAGELYAYGRSYGPPYMWHHTPWALKLCIVFAFLPLASARKWSRPMRIVALVLFFIVLGVQLWTMIQAKGWFGGRLDRLPRPHYLEFYLPVFYSISAAFGLRYGLTPSLPTARPQIPLRSLLALWLVFTLALTVLFGGLKAPLAVLIALPVAVLFLAVPRIAGSVTFRRPSIVRRCRLGYVAVIALPIAAACTWIWSAESFHPMFAKTCSEGLLWCQDKPGTVIGAKATPITDFIRSKLSSDETFVGRADSLLVASPRVTLPEIPPSDWSPALFEKMTSWYRRAYAAQPIRFDHREYHLRRSPEAWQWSDRDELHFRLKKIAANGDIYHGVLPEDVLGEILDWLNRRATATSSAASPDIAKHSEVQIMVEERNRAFAETGNGMLLRALPLHGIPVASSYEQALDFLYFLLWTRYINEGGGEKYVRSINFTALETVHAERLALIGVRYVIARESRFSPAPDLPKVFAWRGYAVHEVPTPNVSGFGVTVVSFADDLEGELRLMRDERFEPRSMATVSSTHRALFEGQRLSAPLQPRISIEGDELVFEGESSEQSSFIVLPFRFSRCWKATWKVGSGTIVRADTALIGVLFSGKASVRLHWSGGYGAYQCLRMDAALARQAVTAAQRLPN